MRCSDGPLLTQLFQVALPDVTTVLDITFGSGAIWRGCTAPVRVTGSDVDPTRAKDLVADFRLLPFPAQAFDAVLLDPPHCADLGQRSLLRGRYGTYRTQAALNDAVRVGVREAHRVARVAVIAKLIDAMHGSRRVYLTQIAIDELGLPFEMVRIVRQTKIEPATWTAKGPQLSARTVDAAWMIFRKDGPVHKRRLTAERRGPT
jgi:hypothetical protein